MNLVIDQGNTRIKVGIFDKDELVEKVIFDAVNQELISLMSKFKGSNAIYSSTAQENKDILSLIDGKRLHVLSSDSILPFKNLYQSPNTLGLDRLANVSGASSKFSGNNCLIIDAGTCITYDFLDNQNQYQGGLISPGLKMRSKAMHHFTGKLPEVELTSQVIDIGVDTKTSLQQGILQGAIAEMEGIITNNIKKYGQIHVILTGGDLHFFEKNLKHPIFADADFTLIGLNHILIQNLEN